MGGAQIIRDGEDSSLCYCILCVVDVVSVTLRCGMGITGHGMSNASMVYTADSINKTSSLDHLGYLRLVGQCNLVR